MLWVHDHYKYFNYSSAWTVRESDVYKGPILTSEDGPRTEKVKRQDMLRYSWCVWRTVSSHSSRHPQGVVLAQFSLYVHKGGLKPHSFKFILSWCVTLKLVEHSSVTSSHMYGEGGGGILGSVTRRGGGGGRWRAESGSLVGRVSGHRSIKQK